MKGKRIRTFGNEVVLSLEVLSDEVCEEALLGVEFAVGEEELLGAREEGESGNLLVLDDVSDLPERDPLGLDFGFAGGAELSEFLNSLIITMDVRNVRGEELVLGELEGLG